MLAETFAVTDTPAVVVFNASQADVAAGVILNNGAETVYLGGANVDSSSNGFPVAAASALTTPDVGGGEKLYAICASGKSTSIVVLRKGA